MESEWKYKFIPPYLLLLTHTFVFVSFIPNLPCIDTTKPDISFVFHVFFFYYKFFTTHFKFSSFARYFFFSSSSSSSFKTICSELYTELCTDVTQIDKFCVPFRINYTSYDREELAFSNINVTTDSRNIHSLKSRERTLVRIFISLLRLFFPFAIPLPPILYTTLNKNLTRAHKVKARNGKRRDKKEDGCDTFR